LAKANLKKNLKGGSMSRTQIWRKRFKKNWKIWLVSLLLALVLIGRLATSVNRLRQPAPKPPITVEATRVP
jgi:hypothetical protein